MTRGASLRVQKQYVKQVHVIGHQCYPKSIKENQTLGARAKDPHDQRDTKSLLFSAGKGQI